jgi:hypothetical protein
MLSHDELVTLETARLAAQNVIDGPGREGGPVAQYNRSLRGELTSRAKWFLSAMDKVKACHDKRTVRTGS